MVTKLGCWFGWFAARAGLHSRHMVILAGVIGSLISVPCEAAENGTSFFLGGTKGPLAGMTPPPGVFVSNNFYFYSGSAGKNIEFPIDGFLVAGVDAELFLDIPTALWVTDSGILDGRFALAFTAPFGSLDMDAAATLTTPHGPLGLAAHDSVTTFADPILTSFMGWDSGNFHWQTGVSVNLPIGDYQKGELANIAFHHWAADFFVAATWLDPKIGLDVSGAMGVIFNGENPATDYTTGDEFHADLAVPQYFSKDFSIGIAGYYYDQFTGDSGDGAKLGDFEGRVAAIGPVIGYNFQVGKLPVTSSLRYYHEFDVENRLEGDTALLSFAMPLWVPGH